MDTGQIELKLTRRPYSPLFARLADAYLGEGRTEAAKELLLSGLEKYPSYPAAHLVLARCYAAEHNFAEALVHLRTAVAALPEVDHLLDLEEEWEDHTLPALPPPPVVHGDTLPASGANEIVEMEIDVADVVVAEAPEPLPAPHAAESMEIAEATHALPAVGATVEPPAPLPVAPARTPVVRTYTSHAGRIEDGRIVSKTLAEIYAMQGEYGEAIITYTMLKHHRPQMSAECDLRISELEQALQAKLHQQKLAVTK